MQSSKITDQNLVKQYVQGNEACLEMLVNRHKDRIFTTIILIVKDSYIAEDLFQETFIKIIKTSKKGNIMKKENSCHGLRVLLEIWPSIISVK